MPHAQRLVNQQLAFAKYQAQQLTQAQASAFAERCHSQAALLQLALGLSAYAAELLSKIGLQPISHQPLPSPRLFREALAQATAAHKTSSDLNECAQLEQEPTWLASALAQIAALGAHKPARIQSQMLQHTSLLSEEAPSLIASSGANPQNAHPVFSVATILAELEALIERHRADTSEY